MTSFKSFDLISINTLIFGKIKYVKDEIVTSTGFTNLRFTHDESGKVQS